MIYFFRGIADPDAIGKSVVSDNYGLVIAGEGSYLDAFGPLILTAASRSERGR